MTLTTRREALIAAASATAAAAFLTACGDNNGPNNGPHTEEVLKTSIAIDYASYYAPVRDLTRLIQAQAAKRHLAVTLSDDAAGPAAQLASVKELTGPQGGFKVVVIAPFDATALAPVVAAAQKRGIKVASFVSPLREADQQVVPNARIAARDLASHIPSRRPVLLVAPPATSPVPDPFFGYASSAAAALRTALGTRVHTTITALGADDAESAIRAALSKHPNIDVIATWNDATALGALAAAPHVRFIGALGAPAPTSRRVLEQLLADNPFRALCAVPLRTMAELVVDETSLLLPGRSDGDGQPAGSYSLGLPTLVLTPTNPVTRTLLTDYAS